MHHSERQAAAITLNHLTFGWPESATPLIDDQTLTIPSGVVGIIGSNGAGKSTLVSLLTGGLRPSSGSIESPGSVYVLPQDLPSRNETVAATLGIAETRDAMLRLLEGNGSGEDVARVGDDWDVEEAALAALAELGYDGADAALLDRAVGTLSGGQAMRVGLAAARLAGATWTVLDEPSNNLDAAGRAVLRELLTSWRGGLLVISHDREVLELVDAIVELRRGHLRLFGGTFAAYREALAAEQRAALAAVAKAEGDLATEKRQRIAAETTIARRRKMGEKAYAEKREPKIVMGNRKRAQQVSSGKLRGAMQEREGDARMAADEAKELVRRDVAIRLDLGETLVPSRRRVLRIADPRGDWEIVGPERIRLVGDNGSGKSSLLAAIAGEDVGELESRAPRLDGQGWAVEASVPLATLDQDPVLPPDRSAFEAIRQVHPRVGEHRVRELLAALELRGDAAERLCRDLSGGERLRVALATVLVAEPAPQLLLLDEPSNNLDLDSVRVLSEALQEFRGAVLLVTHDRYVAEDAGVTHEWEMAEVRGGSPA